MFRRIQRTNLRDHRFLRTIGQCKIKEVPPIGEKLRPNVFNLASGFVDRCYWNNRTASRIHTRNRAVCAL